jgi:hypothetical protein
MSLVSTRWQASDKVYRYLNPRFLGAWQQHEQAIELVPLCHVPLTHHVYLYLMFHITTYLRLVVFPLKEL